MRLLSFLLILLAGSLSAANCNEPTAEIAGIVKAEALGPYAMLAAGTEIDTSHYLSPLTLRRLLEGARESGTEIEVHTMFGTASGVVRGDFVGQMSLDEIYPQYVTSIRVKGPLQLGGKPNRFRLEKDAEYETAPRGKDPQGLLLAQRRLAARMNANLRLVAPWRVANDPIETVPLAADVIEKLGVKAKVSAGGIEILPDIDSPNLLGRLAYAIAHNPFYRNTKGEVPRIIIRNYDEKAGGTFNVNDWKIMLAPNLLTSETKLKGVLVHELMHLLEEAKLLRATDNVSALNTKITNAPIFEFGQRVYGDQMAAHEVKAHRISGALLNENPRELGGRLEMGIAIQRVTESATTALEKMPPETLVRNFEKSDQYKPFFKDDSVEYSAHYDQETNLFWAYIKIKTNDPYRPLGVEVPLVKGDLTGHPIAEIHQRVLDQIEALRREGEKNLSSKIH